MSISLYQTVESTPAAWATKAHFEHANSAIWQLEVVVVTSPPKSNQPTATYIESNVEYLLTVALMMKGLVDLVPLES